METYLLGENTSTEVSQRDLEAAGVIIIVDLDGDQSVRPNIGRRLGSHCVEGGSQSYTGR